MEATKHGGLSGKARRVRYRNRASRVHAEDLLNEYYEPDPMDMHESRDIPIRHRGEFRPATAAHVLTPMAQVGGSGEHKQLELPLGVPQPARTTEPRVAAPRREEPLPHTPEEEPIRFTKPADPSTDPLGFGLHCVRRKQPLTLRGLLVGCAMGTAAAGLLLIALRVAFG